MIGEFAPDDLAVIRVTKDAGSLKPAKFANSSETQIGEIVLAMGNPLRAHRQRDPGHHLGHRPHRRCQ